MDNSMIFLLENDFTLDKINNINLINKLDNKYIYYINYLFNYFNDEISNTQLMISIFILITILFKKFKFLNI